MSGLWGQAFMVLEDIMQTSKGIRQAITLSRCDTYEAHSTITLWVSCGMYTSPVTNTILTGILCLVMGI